MRRTKIFTGWQHLIATAFFVACSGSQPNLAAKLAPAPHEKAVLACARSIALAEGFYSASAHLSDDEARTGATQERLQLSVKLSLDSVWAHASIRSGSATHWRNQPATPTGHRVQSRINTECRMARVDLPPEGQYRRATHQ